MKKQIKNVLAPKGKYMSVDEGTPQGTLENLKNWPCKFTNNRSKKSHMKINLAG